MSVPRRQFLALALALAPLAKSLPTFGTSSTSIMSYTTLVRVPSARDVEDIDNYVLGVLKREPVSFKINFVK